MIYANSADTDQIVSTAFMKFHILSVHLHHMLKLVQEYTEYHRSVVI